MDDSTMAVPVESPIDWDETDADRLGIALRLLTDLISVLAARARATTASAELHAEELRYAEERQRLEVLDRSEIRRILTTYPARISQLQASGR